MGRKKKSSTVEIEEESDDEELTVFSSSEGVTSLTQEVIDKYEIKPVRAVSDLPSPMTWFTGKSYDDSIRLAYEWRDRVNKENTSKVELVSYFPQLHKGKNIILSYKVV